MSNHGWTHRNFQHNIYRGKKRALHGANNLPTFRRAEQRGPHITLHKCIPFATNANKLISVSFICLHVWIFQIICYNKNLSEWIDSTAAPAPGCCPNVRREVNANNNNNNNKKGFSMFLSISLLCCFPIDQIFIVVVHNGKHFIFQYLHLPF